MKVNSVQTPEPNQPAEDANKTPPVREASREQFEQAQQKTSKLHAGLFRRLAK